MVDDGDVAVIIVAGELDSFAVCDLRAGITEVLGRPATLIDIRGVPFVDSAGLGALMGGIRRLREAGGNVVLCCTHSGVVRLLLMTGLERLVAITESRWRRGAYRRCVGVCLVRPVGRLDGWPSSR